MNEITSDDKLWAALSWIFFPVAVIALLMEEKKNRPFIKYHAVHSLAFTVIFSVILTIVSAVTCGMGSVLGIVGFVVFYWAYLAYQGQWVEISFVTDFVKKQNWI